MVFFSAMFLTQHYRYVCACADGKFEQEVVLIPELIK